jgi:hypothetical protein
MAYDYILYVDESGDPGLRTVRPLDVNGASEWMTMGGVLISARREQQIQQEIGVLRASLRGHKAPHIHFADLSPSKKAQVMGALASWPIRGFVVCSNKRNMRGQHDAKPEANIVEVKSWFYAWLFRVLLERVSKYVRHRSMAELGRPGTLKIELSQRGGVRYVGIRAYLYYLRQTFRSGVGALPQGTIDWDVIDIEQIRDYSHRTRAGLQMADWVAGAFFKAADKHNTGGSDPTFAKLLEPRMAMLPPSMLKAGFSVKLLPNFKRLRVDADQFEIFRAYGYPDEWWEK